LPIGPIRRENTVIGEHIQAQIIKSRVLPRFRKIGFDIMYNHGIIKIGEIFDLGVQLGIIQRRDNKYFFQDQELGAEREQALTILQHSTLDQALEQVIRQKLLPDMPTAATSIFGSRAAMM
jgi:recombination protein RecA